MTLSRDDIGWLRTFLGRGRAPLSHDALGRLARVATREHSPAGRLLYPAGEYPPGVWIVRTGLVELYTRVGGHRQVVCLLRSEDVVGDTYLLLGREPSVAARARTALDAYFIDADSFMRLFTDPLTTAWLCNLSSRMWQARDRVTELAARTVEQRVATVLVLESADGTLQLPQQVVAEMLGTSRSSVNRVLRQLEELNLISLGYGEVKIEDEDGLKRIASLAGD